MKFELNDSFDPLNIGTIEDDDDVPMDEDDGSEELAKPVKAPTTKSKTKIKEPVKAAKGKKGDKKAAKITKDKAPAKSNKAAKTEVEADPNEGKMELNPDFSFEADGGLSLVNINHPWDFTDVKTALRQQMRKDDITTTIDDKIQRKRAAKKKEQRLAAAEKNAEAGSEGEAHDGDSDNEELSGSGEEDDDQMSDDGDEMEFDDDEESEPVQNGKSKSAKGKRNSKTEDDSSDDNVGDDDDEEPDDIVHDKRKAEYFEAAPEVDESMVETFTTMRLSRPILKGIAAMGFVKPTAIQAQTIPIAMQGKDICGSAVTGSGKTAAFIIPILERLLFRPKNTATTRVLILVPTRELGVQCHSVATNLAKFSDIQFCLCVGGLSTKIQETELKKRPDVVIATPGRLIDHIHNSRSFHLESVEILIMDEADRMLEDGFAAELNEIIKNTPKGRQTMLFSATMTDNVDDLIKLSLNRPVRLFVDRSTALASRLVQEFIRVRSHREESRPAILAALCTRTYKSETIVFFRSKAAAHHMKMIFGLIGLSAQELHGNLTQLQRLEALEAFRDKKCDFLLATDLASRGLDIAGIKTVINYDMPRNYAQYIHRIGRTARGGAGGRAVSLVGEADRTVLKLAIKNSTDEVKHRVVPSAVIQKYEKKLEKLADTIKELYAEEKEEKELRKAEMDVTKMQNMMEHEDEIKSRPARTWFQSEKEKQESKDLGTAKHNADFGLESDEEEEEKPANRKRKFEQAAAPPPGPKRGKFDGLSRKQKRTKQALEEDAKEIAKQARVARSVKKSARPQRMHTVAERPLKPSGPAPAPKKKGVVFDQEIIKTGGKKKLAPKISTTPKKDEKKRDPTKKPGKLKSAKSFKSKSKFKRR
ncbi:P-loop containing nucleoside triphosphate hydrolase protein [Phlyctochytrium arcticum]|nr:P-loop containing nucleoside triphosphate hydrolase protein [Phlyctochytrium arcticum]